MNYSGVLENRRLMKKPNQRQFDMDNLNFSYQKRPQSAPKTNFKFRVDGHGQTSENSSFVANDSRQMSAKGGGITRATLARAGSIIAADGTSSSEKKIHAQQDRSQSATKTSTAWLSTTPYEEKAGIYEKYNQMSQLYASVRPQSSKVGPKKNPLDFTKHVKQIDDIEFEEDEGFDEDQNYLLRKLPPNVMTEKSLRDSLNPSVEMLNLQNHKWLRKPFLEKFTHLVPNLRELNIRNLGIEDSAVLTMAENCPELEKIDFSRNNKLTEGSLKTIIAKSPHLISIKLSQCPNSVTDAVIECIANLQKLQVLDISFCKKVTDQALSFLANGVAVPATVVLTGLNQLTNDGFDEFTQKKGATIKVFDMALMDHELIGNETAYFLSRLTHLEELNLTGCINITDEGFRQMLEGTKENPVRGFSKLRVLRLNGVVELTDMALGKLQTHGPCLERLELIKNSNVSDLCILNLAKKCPGLAMLDVTYCMTLTDQMLQDISSKYNINVKRHKSDLVDPNDDGLRVPLPKVKKEKKGKKKKGKKKKGK